MKIIVFNIYVYSIYARRRYFLSFLLLFQTLIKCKYLRCIWCGKYLVVFSNFRRVREKVRKNIDTSNFSGLSRRWKIHNSNSFFPMKRTKKFGQTLNISEAFLAKSLMMPWFLACVYGDDGVCLSVICCETKILNVVNIICLVTAHKISKFNLSIIIIFYITRRKVQSERMNEVNKHCLHTPQTQIHKRLIVDVAIWILHTLKMLLHDFAIFQTNPITILFSTNWNGAISISVFGCCSDDQRDIR